MKHASDEGTGLFRMPRTGTVAGQIFYPAAVFSCIKNLEIKVVVLPIIQSTLVFFVLYEV